MRGQSLLHWSDWPNVRWWGSWRAILPPFGLAEKPDRCERADILVVGVAVVGRLSLSGLASEAACSMAPIAPAKWLYLAGILLISSVCWYTFTNTAPVCENFGESKYSLGAISNFWRRTALTWAAAWVMPRSWQHLSQRAYQERAKFRGKWTTRPSSEGDIVWLPNLVIFPPWENMALYIRMFGTRLLNAIPL